MDKETKQLIKHDISFYVGEVKRCEKSRHPAKGIYEGLLKLYQAKLDGLDNPMEETR